MNNKYILQEDVQTIKNVIEFEIDMILIGLGKYISDPSDDSSILDIPKSKIVIELNHKNELETAKTIAQNGKQENISKLIQVAFNHLLEQSVKNGLLENSNFKIFENLFYILITNAYKYQRYSAHSEELLQLDYAKKFLTNKQYDYIEKIYTILQLEFEGWIIERAHIINEKPTQNTKAGRLGNYPTLYYDEIPQQISKEKYWNTIKEIALEAHNLIPEGETANRIMLIADVKLIFEINNSEGKSVSTPKELLRYFSIRDSFMDDCYSSEYIDIDNLPFLQNRSTKSIAESELKDENEEKIFLDKYYNEITLSPSSIFTSKALSALATNEKLSNDLLQAQEEKKMIINGFSHTYKNMRATNLLEVANVLMSTGDEKMMAHGRTLLLEYSTKQSLTKDIELLQLRFEDNEVELKKKIKESMYSDASIGEAVSIVQILSDAFKRCLVTLFYDSKHGLYMRRGFRENANFSKKLKPLCEQFEKDILFKDGGDTFEWFSENMCPVSSNYSQVWRNLKFEKDNYAAILITGLLAELTANIFKYANKGQCISYVFEDDADKLIISTLNVVANDVEKSKDSGNGLIANNEVFRLLNKSCGVNNDAITAGQKHDGHFETKFVLSKSVLN